MITIRDANNPLETCTIELSDLKDDGFLGLFEIENDTIKIWFLLDVISKEQSEKLFSTLYQNYVHTVKITSKQGNCITSFQTITVSPIEDVTITKADGSITKKPYPMVPNGLIMMKSQNWVEDILVDDLKEEVFRRAVFTFPYLPYWFNQSLEVGSPRTVQIGDGLSFTFSLEESKTIQRFSIQESRVLFSRVIVFASSDMSILDFYNLHRDILLLFRFCTGICLPKANIVFEPSEDEQVHHKCKFHYLFPFKGLAKEVNSNQYLRSKIKLSDLMNNPCTITRWFDCMNNYQHAMELMGEIFYSDEVVISDRVLKLLQVFDRLDKAYCYDNKKDGVPSLYSRLKSFVEKQNLSFHSITELENDKICHWLKEYRNSESHGDCNKDSLSFEQMEKIMHIMISTMLIDKVLCISEYRE